MNWRKLLRLHPELLSEGETMSSSQPFFSMSSLGSSSPCLVRLEEVLFLSPFISSCFCSPLLTLPLTPQAPLAAATKCFCFSSPFQGQCKCKQSFEPLGFFSLPSKVKFKLDVQKKLYNLPEWGEGQGMEVSGQCPKEKFFLMGCLP